MNALEQLRQHTVVVADTGDLGELERYKPQDATTNPSLVLKAASLPRYQHLIADAVAAAADLAAPRDEQVQAACDNIAVRIGREILKIVPGRISTEVDARLSFDTAASVAKARRLIGLYGGLGVSKDRVLIKLASTWEGIRAAEILEHDGINCNLTLLFSRAQARACAEAGVTLISPFVGRILDWYQEKAGRSLAAHEDPGVHFVTETYHYYKARGYATIVMGASFRNVGEILALAGCDRLTIGPALLRELSDSETFVERRLAASPAATPRPVPMSEAQFRADFAADTMADEKLTQGINGFIADQIKLETMVAERF